MTKLYSTFALDEPLSLIQQVVDNIEQVMIGKRHAIERVIISLLCGGHVLLEDVPGVGKTLLVKALAKTVDMNFRRVQFTPDLLPSDVTGVSIYNRGLNEFQFRPGPLFSNIVLADELNRASPKTQAALLEAMEEKHVTIDGETYPLPRPFILLATQNPLDQTGTYQLPEAQLDRFFMRIRIGYPEREQEIDMMSRMQQQSPLDELKPVLLPEQLHRLQRQIRQIHVAESIKQYIVDIATSTRNNKDIVLGASPRAVLALMIAAQAAAFVKGRRYAIPDDVKGVLQPVIAHRLILGQDARMSARTAEQVLTDIANRVAVPHIRYAPGS